jgi:hypothetical protein
MLTSQENEILTRVGPATPMGRMMRRFWHVHRSPLAGLSKAASGAFTTAGSSPRTVPSWTRPITVTSDSATG